MQQLEMTVSKLLAEEEASRVEKASLEEKLQEIKVVKMSQVNAEMDMLKTEVASLKEAVAKEQTRLHEVEVKVVTLPQLHAEIGALQTEVASLNDTTAKEQAKLHEASDVEKKLLEAQLKEMKAALVVCMWGVLATVFLQSPQGIGKDRVLLLAALPLSTNKYGTPPHH